MIREFRRSDGEQVTALVNAHAQAVVPGVAIPVNTVLGRLEREPGEYVVDPWVTERVTLVAEQRGRVSAAAHLLRYGAGPDVGPALRDTAEIRWILCWPDSPVWPDASAAGRALARVAVAALQRWRVRRVSADGALPVPGVYGVPEQWPHVRALLEEAGFVRGDREELVYLADVAQLPSRVDGLDVVRTLGVAGTRFTARRDGADAGYIEIDTAIGGTGTIATAGGAADVGNLHVEPAFRRQGIATALLGEVAGWLRLAGVTRLLDYCAPDDADHRAFLEHRGFRLLTRTARDWELG